MNDEEEYQELIDVTAEEYYTKFLDMLDQTRKQMYETRYTSVSELPVILGTNWDEIDKQIDLEEKLSKRSKRTKLKTWDK